jgi:DNA mismatch repair protein MutH
LPGRETKKLLGGFKSNRSKECLDCFSMPKVEMMTAFQFHVLGLRGSTTNQKTILDGISQNLAPTGISSGTRPDF